LNKVWDLLLQLYMVWIEPASVKEITSQSLLNVSEVYESEISKGACKNTAVLTKNAGAAVITMLSSFVALFSLLLERLKLFLNMNDRLECHELCQRMYENARNYALNKFFHFYYENIASVLTSECCFLFFISINQIDECHISQDQSQKLNYLRDPLPEDRFIHLF
jgi:hypothetical protein